MSERMPEPYEYVLVTDGFVGCEVMRVNSDGYWGPAKSLYHGDISHWMPLPEPPEVLCYTVTFGILLSDLRCYTAAYHFSHFCSISPNATIEATIAGDATIQTPIKFTCTLI
ncbi:TPA: DUF551 domain-containing protein [Escherichia coli]